MKIETVVLIPNLNGKNHLKECLSSLFKQSYKKFKIILIDNNSIDNSVEYVKENFPNTDILQLNENQGFAKAINLGIRYSIKKYNPKYIALLNNDTKVDKNWLFYLTKSIESENKIAAVTSNMLFYNNPKMINSQGGACNIIGNCYDINIFKKIKDIKKFQKKVFYACGGAMLLKTIFLKNIGVFDGRYFTYCEDLDWGWRANLCGYKIIFCEKAEAYHKGSAYWKKFPLEKEYLCKRNSLCTIIKNYELKTLIKISPFLFWNYISYPIWALINKKIPFKEKTKFVLIPLKSVIWNIKNIKKTLKLRKNVQSNKKLENSSITKLMVKK